MEYPGPFLWLSLVATFIVMKKTGMWNPGPGLLPLMVIAFPHVPDRHRGLYDHARSNTAARISVGRRLL
jgi:hypothetical protein